MNAVLPISADVVRWTIDHMARLRHVIAMGNEAQIALHNSGIREFIQESGYGYHEVHHPSFAMSDDARFAEWTTVFDSK